MDKIIGDLSFDKKAYGLKKRADLPLLLNNLKLNGSGVEIGVQTGHYSKTILSKSNLKVLYSIDPWVEFKNKEYEDVANMPQFFQNLLYFVTKFMLKKFKERSVIMRMKSEDASNYFNVSSLDFVYIDALHTYEGCKKDLELWWPKVRNGGLIAGHDYLDGDMVTGKFGVKKAVNEFAKKHCLELYVTDESWPTWYAVKKEPQN